MELFQVGGAVRDELLGLPSKDQDFTVVLDEGDLFKMDKAFFGRPTPFEYMVFELQSMGFKIFLESPEFLTVRAQFPDRPIPVPGSVSGSVKAIKRVKKGLTADFVLARKESGYTDGRRPDKVEPGTLMDDLARRDFTMNAIAKDADGSYIDPFNGLLDIESRVIRAVGSAHERFEEDALRMLRAVRFKVTKGFTLHHDIMQALHNPDLLDRLTSVSDERIKDELNKMLHFDTIRSLQVLDEYKDLRTVLFSGTVSLDATMKTRGRKGNTARPKPNKGTTTRTKCF